MDLLGLVIKGFKGDLGKLGKDIKDKIGITGMVDDTVDVQEKYVTDTFGPHLKDIEELDFTEEYAGPWPHEDMPPIPGIYRGNSIRSKFSPSYTKYKEEDRMKVYATYHG